MFKNSECEKIENPKQHWTHNTKVRKSKKKKHIKLKLNKVECLCGSDFTSYGWICLCCCVYRVHVMMMIKMDATRTHRAFKSVGKIKTNLTLMKHCN